MSANIKDVFRELEKECEKENISTTPVKLAEMMALMGANPTGFLCEAISAELTKKAEKERPWKMPSDYTEIERAIHEMLVENTGVHILDSGGAYGRHWERNRKVEDFRKEPVLDVTVWDDGMMEFSLSVFHFLTTFLDIDNTAKALQKMFDEFAESEGERDQPWLTVMEDFAEKLEELGFESHGPWNTYDEETILSQVLQGITLFRNGDEYDQYVILQIHNGCDVRGGYTRPRIFKVVEPDYMLMAMGDVNASCGCTDIYSDDCGYHWYNRDGSDEGFPDYWKVEPKREGAESWEYQYRCMKCGKVVEFYPNLDF